jgi:hypothetical protein
MCPGTLAIVGGAAGAGGGIFSALGGITSGEAGALSATAQGDTAAYQAQVARNNAIIAGYNATEAEQAGEQQAFATSMQGAQQGAKIKTSQAANNIDVNTGSAKDVQESQREVEQLNTETVLNNANLQAYGYRNQAAAFTAEAGLQTLAANEAGPAAELAEQGGALAAGAGLLGSASSIGFKYAGLGTGNAPTGGTTSNPTLAGSLY